MEGAQWLTGWIASVFVIGACAVYIATPDASKPEVLEWIKGLFDWAVVAGAGGVAGGGVGYFTVRRFFKPQVESIHARLAQL